jgi:hypothetical protein
LFDSLVEPIILYGSEVWGFENIQIMEKINLKFCKRILNHIYAKLYDLACSTSLFLASTNEPLYLKVIPRYVKESITSSFSPFNVKSGKT